MIYWKGILEAYYWRCASGRSCITTIPDNLDILPQFQPYITQGIQVGVEAISMKEKMHFTILSNDSTEGDGGYGVGTLDLNNVTPIIIDCENEHVFIDLEALHGRSKIEKKVRFSTDLAHASDDYNRYWIVWVALQVGENGPYYAGCTASEVRVSKEERRIKLGYKSLPEQVNFLDKALKGKFLLNHVDSISKKLLYQFLTDFNEEYWKHSPEELKQQLSIWEDV